MSGPPTVALNQGHLQDLSVPLSLAGSAGSWWPGIDGSVIKLGGWGPAVDLTPGTASTIFFQIRPFWPSYLDAFTIVKALYLPKWSAFFYEGQIFMFSPAAS